MSIENGQILLCNQVASHLGSIHAKDDHLLALVLLGSPHCDAEPNPEGWLRAIGWTRSQAYWVEVTCPGGQQITLYHAESPEEAILAAVRYASHLDAEWQIRVGVMRIGEIDDDGTPLSAVRVFHESTSGEILPTDGPRTC